jgi:DNA-binding NarL/FixJ family response regulator
MVHAGSLESGREAVARQAWGDAYHDLSAADATERLDVDDLERLALSASMVGRIDDAARAWERAYHGAIDGGQPARAVRHAFHIIMSLGQHGDFAQAGAWHARATGVLDAEGLDVVERGYLIIPEALLALQNGDSATAFGLFERVAELARRFGDHDLATYGRLGRGQSLVSMGDVARGVAFLDEAMLAVTAGEVSPITVGTVYCAAIEAFGEVFDLRRAQEWTAALSAWCDAQPGLVPFRGRCLVYRTEIMEFHGLWGDADREARRAQAWLAGPPVEPAIGEAHYRRAELHRLRGKPADAEREYREASQWGRRPDPGLALLRLASGDGIAAAASIRRALDETAGMARARLLAPFIEIMLAVGDVAAARSATAELAALAARSGAALLLALAARAEGEVRLAEGDAREALTALRQAAARWQELDSPYESARVRVGIGRACRVLGDGDAAQLEFDAARRVFAALGAMPDLGRLERLAGEGAADRPGGLTGREIEILQLLATGRTNRAIAAGLTISERTVDRHVSNIYTKLDVSTRAGATAWAYEHDLV